MDCNDVLKRKTEISTLNKASRVLTLGLVELKTNRQKEQVFSRKLNAELPIITISCCDCDDCGGLPAAVYVGPVTHSKMPYRQRLSLAAEI